MRKAEIQEKYWIEFLLWYRGYKDALIVANSLQREPVSTEDLFWYWLTRIRAKDNVTDFINSLSSQNSNTVTNSSEVNI